MKDSLLKYRIHQSNTVHESDSEAKVKFEVNWLISERLKHLGDDVDYFEVMNSMKRNHYIDYEVLASLLVLNKGDQSEKYLDFENDVTAQLVRGLK